MGADKTLFSKVPPDDINWRWINCISATLKNIKQPNQNPIDFLLGIYHAGYSNI